MAHFDPYVEKLSLYVEELRTAGRQVREFRCPSALAVLAGGVPGWGNAGERRSVILRRDTFVELGSPDSGSCAFLLWTDDPALVSHGRITLIGPDIPEAPGGTLPFGQVLLVGGVGLDGKDQRALEGIRHVSDRIEGYMVRSDSLHSWGRVSRDAAARGFSFETLGRGLMAAYLTDAPKVEAMEVVFVTSGREDLQPLEKIATQAATIAGNLAVETWKAKGYDIECSSALGCTSCASKPMCDDVREVLSVRRKGTVA
jgi:CO dehydrogenase/acetyl-CoA synthase beta subunit